MVVLEPHELLKERWLRRLTDIVLGNLHFRNDAVVILSFNNDESARRNRDIALPVGVNYVALKRDEALQVRCAVRHLNYNYLIQIFDENEVREVAATVHAHRTEGTRLTEPWPVLNVL